MLLSKAQIPGEGTEKVIFFWPEQDLTGESLAPQMLWLFAISTMTWYI